VNDTIRVIVADTAAHLCRCSCNYMLHAELYDLPLDGYTLICERQDYSSKAILYSTYVHRN
jgi:hypothetical protein